MLLEADPPAPGSTSVRTEQDSPRDDVSAQPSASETEHDEEDEEDEDEQDFDGAESGETFVTPGGSPTPMDIDGEDSSLRDGAPVTAIPVSQPAVSLAQSRTRRQRR